MRSTTRTRTNALRRSINRFLENEIACACTCLAIAIVAISIDLLNAAARLS
ncbi:hypothetical protein [Sphingorhabdus pulchriflava]|uniref:hypothetical protein n=1 Tax=Sphingorhabdus pulchriflava TaxID=2292257 RepID=UPI0015F178AF|nr:hypothetical protein [Sphingorhabdus pulchriflava]